MHNPTLMWRKGWFLSATFLLVLSIATVSCKKEVSQLGNDVVDNSELLESGVIDTFSICTHTYYEDSVKSNDRFFGIIGSYNDPVFGPVNSEVFAQFRLRDEAPVFDDPAQITIDSVVLSLVYEGMYGSPGDQSMEVLEIGGTEPLVDTTTYYTFSSFPVTGSNLIVPGTEVHYLDPNTVTIIDTVQVEPQLRMHLDTNFGWHIINEGFNNPASFETNEAFTTFFKGLNIRTNNGFQAPGEGGAAYFDLNDSDTKLTIHYKSDTINREFSLLVSSTGAEFNHIDFNTSNAVQSVIDNNELGKEQFYAQSSHSRAVIEIPGLSNIPPNAIVHSASLELPVQYQSGQPFEPGLDLNVALFTSSTDSTLRSDLSTIGLFNTSSKKFTIDLRNYVQRIVSGEVENTGFIVAPFLYSHTLDRVIFNGPESTNKEKPKFKIVYTEF